MSRHMKRRTTVRLPNDLLASVKRITTRDGRTLTELIEDGLRRVVDDEKKDAKRKRVLPRISKATGGLQPGIDLTRFSDYQEMEDLEYAERLRKGFK
jgi:hypothetical protein